MAFSSTHITIQHLNEQVSGRVITPADSDYEQLRLPWNRSSDPHPELIVVAKNVDDIVTAINFAREAGIGIAVQSTGHGVQFPADDGLLLITSEMTGVVVDAEAKTAQVEPGALWHHVLDEAVPCGLAPLLGSSPHVGVIGYTLGGGIGWLGRRYGLAADSVRSIDVVTADGVRRHTSPMENAELFWGLRGGGGNFGVVTSMSFDLYPVASVYGGYLTYPAELARDALLFFRDWITSVPDELTSSIAVMKYPSLPMVPAELQGKVEVVFRAAFSSDDVAGGKQWIQPWLDWQTPSSNTFSVIPFSEIGTINNDPVNPVAAVGSNELLDKLSDEVINIIIDQMTDPSSPLTYTELRHAGGAISRADVDINAVGNRDALLYLQMSGLTPTPEIYAAVNSTLRDYREKLRPFIHGGVYLNFTKSDAEENRTQNAYSRETYKRLLALKEMYDPGNMFRYSYPLINAK